MSFSHTADMILAGAQTVTRRLGYDRLKPDAILRAVDRWPRGGRVAAKAALLRTLRVVSVRREPLGAVTDADVAREGFPGLGRGDYIALFCRRYRWSAPWPVTRIEFEYVEGDVGAEVEADLRNAGRQANGKR